MQDFFKKPRPDQTIETEILDLKNKGLNQAVKMIGQHFEQIKSTYPDATYIAYSELPEIQKGEIKNLVHTHDAFIIRANSSALIKDIKDHIRRKETWNPEIVRGGISPVIASYDGYFPSIVLDLLKENTKPLLIYVNQQGKLGLYQENTFSFESDTFPEILEKLVTHFTNFQGRQPLSFNIEISNEI